MAHRMYRGGTRRTAGFAGCRSPAVHEGLRNRTRARRALLVYNRASPGPGAAPVRPSVPTPSIPRMTDHYAALGLGAHATLADVKKAFRQKAAFYHPDRNPSPDAAERFRAVQKAYEVLSDDAARQAYDDNRRRNLLDDPLQTAGEIWQSYFKNLLSS